MKAVPGAGTAVDYDIVVVGAGIVGLACAARLARRGSLLLVERHGGICREASSRSSEVVHAGIYYPSGSLKARSCVRGKELLYERCARHGIAAPRIGKVLVATDEEEASRLPALARRSETNGVPLLALDGPDLRRLLPGTPGVAGLRSPTTGIVDSHAYARSFEAEARSHGADVVFHSEVVAARYDGVHRLRILSSGEAVEIRARIVVNAAGLGQDLLSERAGLDVDALGLRQHPCVGRWFTIDERHRGRCDTLLYPVGSASGGGLGVHLCLDVGGGMRLGPDWAWVGGPPFDLRVDPALRDAFWEVGRRLMPWLEPDDLRPGMAGVRAKLVPGPGEFQDFVLREEGEQGLPGWVSLAGIESPGLTAAAALAEGVEEALRAAGCLGG